MLPTEAKQGDTCLPVSAFEGCRVPHGEDVHGCHVGIVDVLLAFIILVVDSIDRERLAITKEELYRMLAHEDLRKAAVLIFANKQDMKGCMTAAEISKYLTLSSIKDHPWHIQSCCALTGEGLCQGLEWMTSRIGVR
ncbi:ADP-ribosylation factor-like protein 5B [Urocitellus parryii]